ncbi:hypothetical protein [Pedobacter antarcticus]|uniref:hypothetical protein n=1 Tax=Pedobacter antarcticus TaxID=34086 RepID=UPI00292D52DD|nr:hypothetical protein [Pedobacter antarcticus]
MDKRHIKEDHNKAIEFLKKNGIHELEITTDANNKHIPLVELLTQFLFEHQYRTHLASKRNKLKLSILGKQRKGKKSFNLQSEDDFGYNIECIDAAGMVTFNNIRKIQWLNEGEHVFIDPRPLQGETKYDFTRYEKVNIRKAKEIELENFVSLRG